MNENFFPIMLSLQCAVLSALLNIPWGIFWGWFLARTQFRGKALLQAFLFTPLVLPPVLTGYFLVVIFSKNSFLGKLLFDWFQLRFVLDWKGAVLASTVVSSPFMIQMVKESIGNVDQRLEMAARSLGVSRLKVFWTVTIPLAWQGIVAGFFLAFARSIGEFGATIMVAGNIPEKTQTIPSAIYNRFYLGQESGIFVLVFAAIIFSYAGLLISYKCQQTGRHEDRI